MKRYLKKILGNNKWKLYLAILIIVVALAYPYGGLIGLSVLGILFAIWYFDSERRRKKKEGPKEEKEDQ